MRHGLQGVCPHCGSFDNCYLAQRVPLVRVALESVEKDGRGGTNAVVYTDDDAHESISPPGKFYCDNCNKYFDAPKFIK